MPAAAFLDGIDVLVYDTSVRFSESWGRAVVEAMLSGAVPLVPADPRHHLHQLVPHGAAGFHCATRADFTRYARLLQTDASRLAEMSAYARKWAVGRLCDAQDHRARWNDVFALSERTEASSLRCEPAGRIERKI